MPGRAVHVGERFAREVTFDAATIRAGAVAAGDHNPLHHDAAAAAASRFGALIASGGHTAALLAGVMATALTGRGPCVGLEFSCVFRRAVREGRAMRLEWTVVGLEPAPRMHGDLVRLEGRITDAESGELMQTARASCLMLEDEAATPTAGPSGG